MLILILIFSARTLAVDKSTIKNTVHNLSTTGPGTIKSSSQNKVCVFCHTPHNSNPAKPLWNHSLSNQTYTGYDSSTLDATSSSMKSMTGTPTKLCLSCHDGTIAIGDLANMNISVSDSSGNNKLDSDESLSSTASTNLETDLSDDHPVLFAPDSSDGEVKTSSDGVNLYDSGGYLQCTSCHDPHDNTYNNFLVQDNTDSALCTTCHDKTGWLSSVHNEQLNCQDCHMPHNANETVRLRAASEEKLCYQCHDDNGSRYSEWASISDIGSIIDNVKANGGSMHPIEDSNLTGRHDALENNKPGVELPIAVTNKHSECSDCHDPHQVTASNPLEGVPGFDLSGNLVGSITNIYELCYKCHQNSNSNNDVKDTFENRSSTHPEECTRCHGDLHGSNVQGLLKKQQPDLCVDCHDGDVGYSNSSSKHPTDCTACHGDSTKVNQSNADVGIPHGSDVSPILKDSQNNLCSNCHNQDHNGGNCTSCHTPHGSDITPILKDDPVNLCSNCHGGQGTHQGKNCTDCHDVHPPSGSSSVDSTVCQDCHTDKSTGNHTDCANCHNIHDSTINADCQSCHGSKSGGHPTDTSSVGCQTCHNPHESASNAQSDCSSCHDRPSGEVHTEGDHQVGCTVCHIDAPHNIGVGSPYPVIEIDNNYLTGFNDSSLGSYSASDCSSANSSCDEHGGSGGSDGSSGDGSHSDGGDDH